MTITVQNFITKNDILIYINSVKLDFVKNITLTTQRKEHCVSAFGRSVPTECIVYGEHYIITIEFAETEQNQFIDNIYSTNNFELEVLYKNIHHIYSKCNFLELTESIDDKNRLIKKLVISSYRRSDVL